MLELKRVSPDDGSDIYRMLQEIPLSVIAKGVDDEETADMLTEMGCDFLQGEYFKN